MTCRQRWRAIFQFRYPMCGCVIRLIRCQAVHLDHISHEQRRLSDAKHCRIPLWTIVWRDRVILKSNTITDYQPASDEDSKRVLIMQRYHKLIAKMLYNAALLICHWADIPTFSSLLLCTFWVRTFIAKADKSVWKAVRLAFIVSHDDYYLIPASYLRQRFKGPMSPTTHGTMGEGYDECLTAICYAYETSNYTYLIIRLIQLPLFRL